MTNQTRDYDVIIVGGRVAGSTLAARLGKQGLRVLLLERAEFPSLPAVSSPIIYAGTMAMLDEIGADESAYARNTPKLKFLANAFKDYAPVKLPIPNYKGRDYAYAIDRARFDDALWQTAISYPTVEGRQNTSVTDLLFDGDTVIGVVAKTKGSDKQDITADVVVGADGRFGMVARKTEAEIRDEHSTHPTSIYYAYWENVAQLEDDVYSATAYGSGEPYGYLVMDSADNTAAVTIEGRSDIIEPENGDAENFYLSMLKKNRHLWKRLENAKMITSVRGMRNVGNSYHQAGGAGWAVVGDAYHQKDPLDGQGIYNAVVTSKAFALMMKRWKRGDFATWDDALAFYDEEARIKTYPMYKTLQNSIAQNFYADMTRNENAPQLPEWAAETFNRWVLEDPQMQNALGKFVTREMHPDMLRVVTPALLVGAIARGPLRDLRKRVEERLPFSLPS